MYKKLKKYSFIILALLLVIADTGFIKAHASRSWSETEIMKQKEQSHIRYRKTMDKKVAIFSKQNSDKSVYSTLSNIENDISGGFKNTYNFYEQKYVIRQKNNLNRYNNLLNKINSYDINDTSYDNVKNIYETSIQFWPFLPDDEYGNIMGLYQEEGKPARLLKPGDVVVTHDGVKHWHGATNNSWFSHVAITAGTPEWLEPVNDNQYSKANDEGKRD